MCDYNETEKENGEEKKLNFQDNFFKPLIDECDDFINGLSDIDSEEKYEEVEIDISNETFFKIAKLAHEKDITFNQMCVDILKEHIEELDESN